MRYLVTGGAGFIGSNYVDLLLNESSIDVERVTVLDSLTYAGSKGNLDTASKDRRFVFVEGDIRDRVLIRELFSDADLVVNFAAESHVDRSIDSSHEFIRTNVEGTSNLLDALRLYPKITFLQVSTDEVYGSINSGSWTEDSPLQPNSPYAASKAAADLLAMSFQRTYNLDIRISRCCNNYGPRQFPEKLIPLFVTNIIRGKKLPIYGDGLNAREWIHVEDHCRALNLILKEGKSGETYNIGSGIELTNLDLTNKILRYFSKNQEQIEFVEDRLGHDYRYSLNSGKLENEFGFTPQMDFSEGLNATIAWYEKNETWWESKVLK